MGVAEAFLAAFVTGCTVMLCPAAIIFYCWRKHTAVHDEVVLLDTANRAGGDKYVGLIRRQLDAESGDAQSRITGGDIGGTYTPQSRSAPSLSGAMGAVEPASDFHPPPRRQRREELHG